MTKISHEVLKDIKFWIIFWFFLGLVVPSEYSLVEATAFFVVWAYVGAHLFFGPLDWYLIYVALKKLKNRGN